MPNSTSLASWNSWVPRIAQIQVTSKRMTKLFKTGMSEATKALMIRFNDRTYVVYVRMCVFVCVCVCVCVCVGTFLNRRATRKMRIKRSSFNCGIDDKNLVTIALHVSWSLRAEVVGV